MVTLDIDNDEKAAIDFNDLNPSDTFIDSDGDLCMKIDPDDINDNDVVRLSSGNTYNWSYNNLFIIRVLNIKITEDK